MAEQGRAMRTGLVDLFFNDLKQPWSRWNKIALTLSISWLALMSYVLSRSGPSREFEVLSSVVPGILWITVGVGIVALTKKGAGKIVTLFLLIVSIVALGLPILVLTLIWIPMLVLERLSLRDFAFHTVGEYNRIMLLFWVIVALVGSFLFLLLRRVGKA